MKRGRPVGDTRGVRAMSVVTLPIVLVLAVIVGIDLVAMERAHQGVADVANAHHTTELLPPAVLRTNITIPFTMATRADIKQAASPTSELRVTTPSSGLPLTEDPADPVAPKIWAPVTGKSKIASQLVACMQTGMQQKCHFRNIAVVDNRFITCGDQIRNAVFPNPLYLPDGQQGPMIQYHKYRGHQIAHMSDCGCQYEIERPTVFLFRMSGHSTYHLWENNLGPFYATLNEFRSLTKRLQDPSQLVIAFADFKPTKGPKAPLLLDQLLRTFTNVPLLNATRLHDRVGRPVCFRDAILGISANSFPHRDLLHQMMRNIVGYVPSGKLPAQPHCLFVSRNHRSVVRGRKIQNEAEVVRALNATIINATGRPLQHIFMEDLTYREQVELAMRTNILISPHGGGVANCIWMAKGSVLVEFVAPVGKTLLGMYRTMCGKSGVKQVPFLADPDPEDAGNPAVQPNPRLFSNMIVPADRIVQAAVKALQMYQDARLRNA